MTIVEEVRAWLAESWDPGMPVREWWARLADASTWSEWGQWETIPETTRRLAAAVESTG